MTCERCGAETRITIMSMFNEQIICMDCKEKEVKHPMYKTARDTEHKEVVKGNMNYPGIGLPADI